MENWVDFKAVKAAVSMQAILDHYGLSKKLKRSGKELRGRCPIHSGEGTDTFHANTVKNVFQCFSGVCKAKGNVLDFVAAMEKCSVRDAALKLKEWFSVTSAESPPDERQHTPPAENSGGTGAQLAPEKAGERGEPNKPLGFTLKGIDSAHPYLAERGIEKETGRILRRRFLPRQGLHERSDRDPD